MPQQLRHLPDRHTGLHQPRRAGVPQIVWPEIFDRMIRRFSSTRSRMAEHYVCSDGLATVSAFVQPIKTESEPRLTGLHEMGAVMHLDQIRAIGKVPARTVDTIAMSVQPR